MKLMPKLMLIMLFVTVVPIAILGYIAVNDAKELGYDAADSSAQALEIEAKTNLKSLVIQKAQYEYPKIFKRIENEAEGVADFTAKTFEIKQLIEFEEISVLTPWDPVAKRYGSDTFYEDNLEEIKILQRTGVFLRSVVPQNEYVTLGYFATETGITTFSDESVVGIIEGIEGYVVTERAWYKAVIENGKTIWTDVYIDANTKELVVTCATPVYVGGRLVGVVGMDVLLETLQTDILNLDLSFDDSYAFLINKEGKVLVRPNMSSKDTRWDQSYESENLLETSNLEFNAIIKQMISGEKGISTYMDNEDEKIVAYAPIESLGLSLGIVVPMQDVVAPAEKIRSDIRFQTEHLGTQNTIFVITFVTILIVIVLSYIFAKKITGPILKLKDAADKITNGEEVSLPQLKNRDEVAELTGSMEMLISTLKFFRGKQK